VDEFVIFQEFVFVAYGPLILFAVASAMASGFVMAVVLGVFEMISLGR
jgi:hypothetical protein